ncbi:hypothetical protein EV699_108186 [Plasticicumulans lactativorans]|uniref:Spermatogenesis-associated protein 20-like TRX domain-containing protein n=1 Tax=Plasticicumulans lactativorans TaxID=1133106 RepID=A0A4R2L4Z3_9GAMM|nr:thioredoxin domain-containing protein [Plasticicumulans lactativorans]TCO81553.1 hypothetical protein EV699_108186 [Plasticicumulans lactativorans]
MPNRLAAETSPYLLQHAHNPVDWYPWGAEALARAAAEDRPILLSIGYSACHWCHVMAHESFADDAVAAVMNRLFVCIKVDREERPDLDRVYQQAHLLLNGRGGGWPLTAVLTPADRMPYFSGTYFPKAPRHGLPGFAELLERLARVYRERGEDVRAQNEQLAIALAAGAQGPRQGVSGYGPGPRPLAEVCEALLGAFDAEHGGFGGAPKFPQPGCLDRLLRHAAAARLQGGVDTGAEHALRLTLTRMCEGGLFDQLGGGFFRYSVDARWDIPHFEKMLYDQGPLLALLAEAVASGLAPALRGYAEATGAWLLREMRLPGGGFAAALDADSEGEEGRYYVWTPAAARAVLDADEYAFAAAVFGLDAAANFEGRWHLGVRRATAEVAAALGLDPAGADARLTAARAKLLAARATRVPPQRDDKLLAAWNGLAIRGLAVAGRLLGRADFTAAAQAAFACVRRELWRDGRLLAGSAQGVAKGVACLDDYACVLDAALELLQARWDADTFNFARALAAAALAHFEDARRGGCFFTAADHEPLIQRPKPLYDETLPGGNGLLAQSLLRLGHLLGDLSWLVAAERTLKWAWPGIERHPLGACALLRALEGYLEPDTTVLLRGDGAALDAWHARALQAYAPRRWTLAIPASAGALPEALAARTPPAHGVRAYLCSGTQCAAPLDDAAAFGAALAAAEPRFAPA